MPRPRERHDACDAQADKPAPAGRSPEREAVAGARPRTLLAKGGGRYGPSDVPRSAPSVALATPAPSPEVIMLAPNVISVQHWDRLLGGLLYAASPRVDWATLLRRNFDVDVLQCPKCHGRLRVIAVITERDAVNRILTHLGRPTAAPPLARARDPTDEPDDAESESQLELALA